MITVIVPLIRKHLLNIPKSKKIIGFVLLILLANQLGGNIVKALITFDINFTPKYVFKDVWLDIPGFVGKYWIYYFTIIPLLHLGLTLVGLACFRRIAEQFMPDYWQKHKIYGSSKTAAVIWFYKQKLFINLGYVLLIAFFYSISYLIYLYYNINSLWFLFFVIVFSYPVFYFTQSVVGLLATLPLKNSERSESLKYLYCKRGIKTLYWFYAVRIGLEIFLAFLLPLIFYKLKILEFLIPWLVVVGLAVPFSFLRSLSYEIKLNIFKGDKKIDSLRYVGLV